MVLRDPPEVKQYAKRGDPPMDQWPGRIVTREDLMKAGGDPRDWFRYGHRLKAYEEAWAEFADARRRRRNFKAGFDWNQILVLGDYGAGKTSVAVHMARHFFGLGHPVFSNASCLFGWHLEHEEMYTAMGFMPANSVLLIDESSAALASRVGHGVSVSSFVEMNLNTRKRNCMVVYMSAQDWEISASIRRNCREVWMPVPKDDLDVADSGGGGGTVPAENPDNFRLAWHVWDDYPYRKANLIEGPNPDDKGGFGPPTKTKYDEGKLVRRAFLLNDTFELAQAGAATTSDRDVVKQQLLDFRHGKGPHSKNGNGKGPADELFEQLLMYFEAHEDDPPQYFTPGQVASALGVSSPKAGTLVTQLIPGITQVRNKGYPSDVIYDRLDSIHAQLSQGGGQ